jgi:anti-anti-sigma factor
VERARATVCVRPIGALDLLTAPAVDAELTELWSVGFKRLALDLRETSFLDSAGLRLVLDWAAHASGDGFAFGVIPGPPPVQRVLQLAGAEGRVMMWASS